MSEFSVKDYLEASILIREIAERMLERLEIVTLQPKIILDLGCGVGYSSELLKKRYPNAQIISIDSTFSFLQYGHQQSLENPVCSSINSLPFADQSVDLIFSVLSLPLRRDLEVFSEWRRVLRPNGLMMFTSYGPDTLKEIRMQKTFIDMHDVGDMLIQTGWVDPVLDVEYVNVNYREKAKLLHELQVMDFISETDIQIEKNSQEVYPLTFEIVYGHAWGPLHSADGFAPDQEGVARIPLSHLRRRK